MLVVGIDVGSVTTKAVLMDKGLIGYKVVATGASPREAGWECLELLLGERGLPRKDIGMIVGTGYGRISLPFVDKAVTEITCHARGAAYLVPAADTVVDIGGQDSKVIRLAGGGKVADFVMNDKCAAGTGRFLQVIAAALGADVSELSTMAEGKRPVNINSTCAVFAESEVIGLLARGEDKGSIVAGLHQAIARRIASMAQRLGPKGPVVFTGGVAKNDGMRRSLEEALSVPVIVPQQCQIAGAIGAALGASERRDGNRWE